MPQLGKLRAAIKDTLKNVSAHVMTMPLRSLGPATALTLVLAAAMACAGPGSTETSRTAPIQASTPITEPIAETLDHRTAAPSKIETASNQVVATPPHFPSVELIWRLSPPNNGPFNAGEELSLTLDLEPQNLAVSGIQFGLNYPGELLQLLEIVPGGILGPDPLVVDKVDESDSSQGQVLFAMARQGDTVAPTKAGRVALIKMVTRREIPGNGNVMIWLNRVKLTGEKFQTIGQDSVSWSLSGPS